MLPFVDLSECSEHGYFADGLTEEMIAQLGQLCKSRIGVISRYSSMVFKDSNRRAREIGEALQVDYLLEGSARREGDRVRITARLVETASETHLWVETYESYLTDYLSVQTDVAARVARSLAMELIPDEPHVAQPVSSNAAAYQDYLKGRYYWNMLADQGVEPALVHFEQATQLDPSFALAYVGMARVQLLKAEYYGTMPRRVLEAARQSVKRALDLDPHLFEAHLALGEVRRMLEWDWRGAERAYAKAIVLNPSHEGRTSLVRAPAGSARHGRPRPFAKAIAHAKWIRSASSSTRAVARGCDTWSAITRAPSCGRAKPSEWSRGIWWRIGCWRRRTCARDARGTPSPCSRTRWRRRERIP